MKNGQTGCYQPFNLLGHPAPLHSKGKSLSLPSSTSPLKLSRLPINSWCSLVGTDKYLIFWLRIKVCMSLISWESPCLPLPLQHSDQRSWSHHLSDCHCINLISSPSTNSERRNDTNLGDAIDILYKKHDRIWPPLIIFLSLSWLRLTRCEKKHTLHASNLTPHTSNSHTTHLKPHTPNLKHMAINHTPGSLWQVTSHVTVTFRCASLGSLLRHLPL